MSGGPDQEREPDESTSSSEPLNEDGAGLGMSEEGSTFEPEETPEAVEDPDEGEDADTATDAG